MSRTLTSSWWATHASVRPWRTQARIWLRLGRNDRRAIGGRRLAQSVARAPRCRRRGRTEMSFRCLRVSELRGAQASSRPFAFDRPGDYASAIGGRGALCRSPANRKVHGMLVLTRKSNQSIMIGDDVEVSVLSVMGEKVRIGIQAPQEIPVFRKEIYLEIHRDDGLGAAPEDEAAAGEGARAEVADASEAE